jgi:GNAT superfamily N-acetyltransferase
MTLRIERLTGEALQAALPALATLRTQVFREWPYLYEGSEDYERRYLATYARSEGSVIVGAFDGGRIVGAATALPLKHEPANVTAPFRACGMDVARIFYFGESVLLPKYRGRGIGVAFFAERETHARALRRFDKACFCAVLRAPDDPRRPSGHVPLDAFWRNRGYEPVAGLACQFSWRELGEAQESAKTMQFWMRDL